MLTDELCRSADLLHAVCEHGDEQLVPIQRDRIPSSVKGRNVFELALIGEAEHAQKRTTNLLASREQE